MEYTVETIPQKKRNITQEEKQIIERALYSFQAVLSKYENALNAMMEKAEEKTDENDLNQNNPFAVGGTKKETKPVILGQLNEVRSFVYSSWAEAVANAKTPFVCDGKRRKTIHKKAFRDVKEGKYVNKNVRDIMEDFVRKLSFNVSAHQMKNQDEK